MRALIDTNIVLDWLQDRSEFSDAASKIITMSLMGKFEAFITLGISKKQYFEMPASFNS